MHPCLRGEQSWIKVQLPGSKEWGLGCLLRRHAAERGVMNVGGFANYGPRDMTLRLARLLRHHKTTRQQGALQAYMLQLGLSSGPDGQGLPAPTLAEVLDLLQCIARGELEAPGCRTQAMAMA